MGFIIYKKKGLLPCTIRTDDDRNAAGRAVNRALGGEHTKRQIMTIEGTAIVCIVNAEGDRCICAERGETLLPLSEYQTGIILGGVKQKHFDSGEYRNATA